MKLYEYMAYELIEKIKSKEVKIQDVIESCIDRINEVESKLHSFVHLNLEQALKKAKKLDGLIKSNKKIGQLVGLPLANKDLICIKNFPTTCCSKILESYIPPYNATVINKLIEQEHAIHIGNTNMDEFAMGGTTENSCYGPTYNPWNLKYVPGGSSGGSGSAVSAGQT
ncbi:MAG: amidase family protein, partial [Candidatus Thorarchaeota archaeon]